MAQKFAEDGLGWRIGLGRRYLAEWWQGLWQGRETPQTDVDWGNWAEFWQNLGDVLLLLLIVSLSLWAGWTLWHVLRPYWLRWQGRDRPPTPPPSQTLSVSQWQQQARQHQSQGNYTQACLCLYFGMLQHLHERGIAFHQESRTDGEYHRAIASLPHPTPYYTLLGMHQRLKFGNADATQDLLNRCLAAYAQLS